MAQSGAGGPLGLDALHQDDARPPERADVSPHPGGARPGDAGADAVAGAAGGRSAACNERHFPIQARISAQWQAIDAATLLGSSDAQIGGPPWTDSREVSCPCSCSRPPGSAPAAVARAA